jgi:hypothetical protein
MNGRRFILPSHVDTSSGLINSASIHIVERSVMRAIVELMKTRDKWEVFTLDELMQGSKIVESEVLRLCYESREIVAQSLSNLASYGLLQQLGLQPRTFMILPAFLESCKDQLISD